MLDYNSGKSIRGDKKGLQNVRRPSMNGFKTCSNEFCTEINPQPLEAFAKQRQGKFGRTAECKACKHKYDVLIKYPLKRDIILEQSKEYYENNKDSVTLRHSRWRSESQDYIRGYSKKYRSLKPEKGRSRCRKYQASKLQALPNWLTKEQIKQMELFYKNCPEGYEVDHIVPIQGKNVRGLHVPWNLQYLPAQVNRSKGNKY